MKSPLSRQEKLVEGSSKNRKIWLAGLLWGVAFLCVLFMVYVAWLKAPQSIGASAQSPAMPTEAQPAAGQVNTSAAALPAFAPVIAIDSVARSLDTHTIIPTKLRTEAVAYTIQKGDSLFAIAKQFSLKPDTILWANYDTLNDDPDSLTPGNSLRIPPADGIWYQWKQGDTIEAVAGKYKSTAESIISFPGNDLDLIDPQPKAEAYIMIPGGSREYHQWLVPTMWRANSGASRGLTNGCDTSSNVMGTGLFVWPAGNHYLSGNDYFSGHLGIDIAAGTGAPVFAADSGVVVWAAPISGGYGNMIMIDHGNGYHTLYGHLSVIGVSCGQGVTKGAVIGQAGSTGNSTGPHLHFEVRSGGGFINPWYVLP